jgi:hypothetical protein
MKLLFSQGLVEPHNILKINLKKTNKLTQQKETIWETYTSGRGACLSWNTLPRKTIMKISLSTTSYCIPKFS